MKLSKTQLIKRLKECRDTLAVLKPGGEDSAKDVDRLIDHVHFMDKFWFPKKGKK